MKKNFLFTMENLKKPLTVEEFKNLETPEISELINNTQIYADDWTLEIAAELFLGRVLGGSLSKDEYTAIINSNIVRAVRSGKEGLAIMRASVNPNSGFDPENFQKPKLKEAHSHYNSQIDKLTALMATTRKEYHKNKIQLERVKDNLELVKSFQGEKEGLVLKEDPIKSDEEIVNQFQSDEQITTRFQVDNEATEEQKKLRDIAIKEHKELRDLAIKEQKKLRDEDKIRQTLRQEAFKNAIVDGESFQQFLNRTGITLDKLEDDVHQVTLWKDELNDQLTKLQQAINYLYQAIRENRLVKADQDELNETNRRLVEQYEIKRANGKGPLTYDDQLRANALTERSWMQLLKFTTVLRWLSNHELVVDYDDKFTHTVPFSQRLRWIMLKGDTEAINSYVHDTNAVDYSNSRAVEFMESIGIERLNKQSNKKFVQHFFIHAPKIGVMDNIDPPKDADRIIDAANMLHITNVHCLNNDDVKNIFEYSFTIDTTCAKANSPAHLIQPSIIVAAKMGNGLLLSKCKRALMDSCFTVCQVLVPELTWVRGIWSPLGLFVYKALTEPEKVTNVETLLRNMDVEKFLSEDNQMCNLKPLQFIAIHAKLIDGEDKHGIMNMFADAIKGKTFAHDKHPLRSTLLNGTISLNGSSLHLPSPGWFGAEEIDMSFRDDKSMGFINAIFLSLSIKQ